MLPQVVLKPCTLGDLESLQALCRETYAIYFGDHWEGEGLALYLEEQFGTERMQRDLASEAIGYFLIRSAQNNVGFLKINYAAVFEGGASGRACELEKMYIYPAHKGQGIGQVALGQVIAQLRQQGHPLLFLDVLATNEAGIQFYRKLGFRAYSQFRLAYPHFKEDRKGINRMVLQLM